MAAAQALSVGAATEYVALNWKPEAGTRLTVVPLDGDKSRIRTFEMPAWFTFHYVNAFGTFCVLPFPSFLSVSVVAPKGCRVFIAFRSVLAAGIQVCRARAEMCS